MRRLAPLFSLICLGVAMSCLFTVWTHDVACSRGPCPFVRFGTGWLTLAGGLLAFVAGMLLMVEPRSPEVPNG